MLPMPKYKKPLRGGKASSRERHDDIPIMLF